MSKRLKVVIGAVVLFAVIEAVGITIGVMMGYGRLTFGKEISAFGMGAAVAAVVAWLLSRLCEKEEA